MPGTLNRAICTNELGAFGDENPYPRYSSTLIKFRDTTEYRKRQHRNLETKRDAFSALIGSDYSILTIDILRLTGCLTIILHLPCDHSAAKCWISANRTRFLSMSLMDYNVATSLPQKKILSIATDLSGVLLNLSSNTPSSSMRRMLLRKWISIVGLYLPLDLIFVVSLYYRRASSAACYWSISGNNSLNVFSSTWLSQIEPIAKKVDVTYAKADELTFVAWFRLKDIL